ncbi:MAG: hypothetical protein EOM47_01290 [Bacteroidia bacterium]|nr:hypothetical protein [Bacteroidia bacterium]
MKRQTVTSNGETYYATKPINQYTCEGCDFFKRNNGITECHAPDDACCSGVIFVKEYYNEYNTTPAEISNKSMVFIALVLVIAFLIVAGLALALIYVIVTFVPAVPITVLAIMTMAVVLLKRKLSTNKIL